jgi:hypothetical protein
MAGAVTAGIDIGSRSIELVVLEGGGVVRAQTVPTTFDPLGQCRRLMDGLDADRVVATGYGRRLFAEQGGLEGVGAITEIQAYAVAPGPGPRGGSFLDLGGQYSKSSSWTGRPHDPLRDNGRGAAGRASFGVHATALQVRSRSSGGLRPGADKRIPISSMCTSSPIPRPPRYGRAASRPEHRPGPAPGHCGRIAGSSSVWSCCRPWFSRGRGPQPCMSAPSESRFRTDGPPDPDTVGAWGRPGGIAAAGTGR